MDSLQERLLAVLRNRLQDHMVKLRDTARSPDRSLDDIAKISGHLEECSELGRVVTNIIKQWEDQT